MHETPEPAEAATHDEDSPHKAPPPKVLVLGSLIPSFHCFRYLIETIPEVDIVGFVPHQSPPQVRSDQDASTLADAHGVPVLDLADLADLDFDLGLSLMFDRPVSADIVDRPERGFVNIHLGPLPRLRGSLSVLHAIRLAPIDDIWEFSVTMHYMVAAVDQGPIIDAINLPIFPDDTAAELHARAMEAVFPLFSRNIAALVESSERVPARDQEGPAHFFRKGEVDHRIDLTQPAELSLAHIRSLLFPGKPRPYILVGSTRVYLTLDES